MHKPLDAKERQGIQAILAMEPTGSRGWLGRRGIAWTGAALAALSALALFWWWSGSGNSSVRYVTAPVARGNLTVVVTATGSVQPTKKVDVSSELSGIVRRVLVDYNSEVKAGQTLAELDTDKLKATVDASRAKVAAARARVVEAEATVIEKQRDLARKTKLVASHAVATQELDQAQAAHDRAVAAAASARADVGATEADLHVNETNLSKACICSPIDGVILTRKVDPGQTVASTLQAPVLFSIAEDLKQMEVQVDVDEADVGKARAGQGATFTVDAFPERRFPAKIRYVRYASETISGVVTYKAVLDIDNSELLLRPGMTATAEIVVTEVKDALLVPNAALRYGPTTERPARRSLMSQLMSFGPRPRRAPSPPEQSGRHRTVWVLQDGAPTPVRIEAGVTDGKRTEVLGGALQPGQAVIVEQTANRR